MTVEHLPLVAERGAGFFFIVLLVTLVLYIDVPVALNQQVGVDQEAADGSFGQQAQRRGPALCALARALEANQQAQRDRRLLVDDKPEAVLPLVSLPDVS